MRVIFQFTKGIKYEFAFGFNTSMFSSMYFIWYTKWIECEPDEYWPETEYPAKTAYFIKSPKFWFK